MDAVLARAGFGDLDSVLVTALDRFIDEILEGLGRWLDIVGRGFEEQRGIERGRDISGAESRFTAETAAMNVSEVKSSARPASRHRAKR